MQEFNTVQEAMNYAVSKLVKQGSPCINGFECMYGDGRGNHCAIGWLLDKTNSDIADFEGSVFELVRTVLPVPEIIACNLDAFAHFQGLHDAPSVAARDEMEDHVPRRETIISNHLENLRNLGVDTDATPDWKAWIEIVRKA